MKKLFVSAILMSCMVGFGQLIQPSKDWLLDNSGFTADVNQVGSDIVLDNGLLYRRIHIAPNAAIVAFNNLVSEKDGDPKSQKLNRNFEINLDISIPPKGATWYVFR